MSWHTVLSFLWRRDFLISHDGIRKLIEDHIPYRNLEEAKLPVHIVTTDIVTGDSVVLSEGSTAEAIVASTAIPGAFSPIRYKDRYLADGAISSNTPIQVAVKQGRQAPDHSADRARLRESDAAGRRGRQRVACADADDRAATGQRARRRLRLTSNILWCRRCVRWSAHPMISREPPIISIAPSSPPTPGWPSTAWRRAKFRTRCGCTATERRAPERYAAVQSARKKA